MIKCATLRINFACMKHKNSISQINPMRDKEIMILYRKALTMVEYPTTLEIVCRVVSELPASCFYISDTSAFRYVSQRLKGIQQHFDEASYRKEQLYEALYEECLAMREKEKYKSLCMTRIVDIALSHPAPCLGLSPRSIRQKISRYINLSRRKSK